MRPFRFLLLALLLIAPALHALDVPPSPTQWVTDRAGLLDAASAEALNQKLMSFEQQTGAQFIVYIIPSLEGDSMEDFTIRAVERWKVGQKKYDNGLVLFVFPQDQKMRIEVGYGLEGSITDAVSSRVMRETITPHFQRGDWAGGLNAGTDALMERIRKGEAAVAPHPGSGPNAQRRVPQEQVGFGGNDVFFFLVIIAIIMFVVLPRLSRGRRRGRGPTGCGGCFPLFFFPGGGGGITFGGGGFGGGGFGGFGGGGGFSGGGGGFGGGGASGGW